MGCNLGIYVAQKQILTQLMEFLLIIKEKPQVLGAEITKDWFKDSFVNEKVFNEGWSDLVGITVLKRKQRPKQY